MNNFMLRYTLVLFTSAVLSGCATESSQSLVVQKVSAYGTSYAGKRAVVAIGQLENRSSYLNGIFSDNVDRLGNQAKTILATHLQQSGRFNVLDRTNQEGLKTEADFKGQAQSIKGAQYVLTGNVTEFGRKTVGDQQLWGILGHGKSQIAYAKISLNVVDVRTSEIVHSVQGAGEYSLSNREIVGFGGSASYDSTLNGKVLDLAIREAVNNMVVWIESGNSPSTK